MGSSSSTPTTSTPTTSTPTTSECLSVLAFFDHFDHFYGDIRSIDKSNFTVCCDMDGITCANEKVMSIKLNNKELHGSLPDSIKELKSLEVLDLGGNHIFGSIPSFVGELKNLQKLNLQNNQLIGEIPASLNNLSNLTSLEINDNKLSGDLTCSLLNTRLARIDVKNNEGLLGKVWLHNATMTELSQDYAPGTDVFICQEGGSVAFCQSKPKCDIPLSTPGPSGSNFKASTVSSVKNQSLIIDSNSLTIAFVASLGLIALIGLLGYMVWKNRKQSFNQFDPEIKSEKKDKVHRLSLFLAKKTKNPSQMESVA